MHFSEGIGAQPDALTRSRARVADGLPALPAPTTGQVVALVGIGASEYAARGAAVQWRRAGLRAFAVSAAEIPEGGAAADLCVAISETGRSTETIRAVELVGGERSVAVVNAPDSPLAAACSTVLDLGSGEDSPIYTTGYTATLQALGLLGEHWSGRTGDWTPLPALAQRVLDECAEPAERLAAVLDDARVVDVVASGVSAATVGEGALLLRESARLITAAHETRNYLHGPMEPLDPSIACLVVGADREIRLARDAAALGCPTVLVTTDRDVASEGPLTVLRLPRAGSALAQAVLEILPVQLLAWAVARRRGLSVDGFRYQQEDTKSR